MKYLLFTLATIFIFICGRSTAFAHTAIDGHPTLAIGSPAPDFNLPGVDGKSYSLASFTKADILVVVFTCNHCPTAQAYEDRIIKIADDYRSKNVAVVAIMPNDPKSITLSELDYTDMGDSFEEMKVRANEKHFNFPYLYDGDTESTAVKYGPVATPHVFIFDKARKLRYSGRIDDVEKPSKTPHTTDARNAIEALLNHTDVAVKTTKVFGCSVKWAEKKEIVQKYYDDCAKEPVTLQPIETDQLSSLLKNNTDSLRLITFWSNKSNDSHSQLADLVTIYHMYRSRDFQFISVGMDTQNDQAADLSVLKSLHASNINFLYPSQTVSQLIHSSSGEWNGNLPFTIIVEPGGKIVYQKQGKIDPAELKKTIVNNHLIGRYYL